MTAAQLLKREAFVDVLQRAGWEVAGWEELFESGASLSPEAQAEHVGDRADLRLGYWMGDGYAQLECADHREGGTLRLRLYPTADIESVVDRVVDWQDALDAGTLAQFVKEVAPACRGLFLDMGDGEFVALSPDEDS